MTQFFMTGPLGEQVTLQVENQQDMLTKQRAWGKRGWTPGSGEIPAGGFTLPYCMSTTFDWAMIGASSFEIEGQHCVKHRGHIYKRREFEAQTGGKKMPASVKYSRGAKPTDPAHLKEGDEGGVQYVTLIVFRGGGQALSEYEIQQQQPRPQQAAPAVTPAPEKVKSDPPAAKDNRRAQYFAIVEGTPYAEDAGRAELVKAATLHITEGKRVTTSLTEALGWNDPQVTNCIMATAELWVNEMKAGAA